MTENSSDYAGPPGLGIDWSAPRSWVRLLIFGCAVALYSSLITVATGITVLPFTPIVGSFWSFFAHVTLSLAFYFLAYWLIVKYPPIIPKYFVSKEKIWHTSGGDKAIFCISMLSMFVLSAVASYLSLEDLGARNPSVAVGAALGIVFGFMAARPWIAALGDYAGCLHESTAADSQRAQQLAVKGGMVFAFTSMFILLLPIVLIIIVVVSRL